MPADAPFKLNRNSEDTDMGKIEYEIPDRELELLARMLMPEIKKFFADEEVQREFEQWNAQRENDIEEGEK